MKMLNWLFKPSWIIYCVLLKVYKKKKKKLSLWTEILSVFLDTFFWLYTFITFINTYVYTYTYKSRVKVGIQRTMTV